MYPILLKLSESLRIYSFGTLIVLAFLISAGYARRRARSTLDLDPDRVFNVCFLLLFIGLAGARLLYCIVQTDKLSGTPLALFRVWEGGLVFYGGLIAGLVWLSWYLPRKPDLKGWALMDIFALASCLAIAVGRWASFLSGMDYGKPAQGVPWAVRFPAIEGTQIPAQWIGEALHPVQLYESLFALLLFFGLRFVAQRGRARGSQETGRILGLFLVLYAVGRFVLEYFRGDDAERGMVIAGYLSTSQLLSIPVFFAGVAIYLARKRQS